MTTKDVAADKAAAKEDKAQAKSDAKAADKLAAKQAKSIKKAKESRTDLLHVAAVLLASGKDADQAVKGAVGLLEALDNHLEPEKDDAGD